MFGSKKNSLQKQGSGDNSTNIQAQTIVVKQGISFSDAREIAKDVFKANFLELREEAAEIARARADEITEKVVAKLSERHPEYVDEFRKPATQSALYTVQKEYALHGEKDTGDLLVDILVDRVAQPDRNMAQVVLDEALLIAPKLTVKQLDTLTLSFLLTRTRRLDIKNYDEFVAWLKGKVVPFVDNLLESDANYKYLEYLGCGYVRAGGYPPADVQIRNTYRAFFSAGFDGEKLKEIAGEGLNLNRLIIKCFHDPQKLQIGVLDDGALETIAEQNGLDKSVVETLKKLFEDSTMPAKDVQDLVLRHVPEMGKVFDVWMKSPLRHFELTGVGIAIAHANYRRRVGDALNLSIWINDNS